MSDAGLGMTTNHSSKAQNHNERNATRDTAHPYPGTWQALSGGRVAAITSARTLSAVTEWLRSSLYPLWAFDIDNLVILGANDSAYELLGRVPGSLRDIPMDDLMSSTDRAACEAAASLLASGAISGYRAVRHARKSDGTEFEADLWVRVATVDGGSTVGLAIVDLKTEAIPWPLFDPNVELAAIVTDHNWAIEHVSNEVKAILGHESLTYKGSPLLGLIHPASVQNFLSAVARVAADGGKATLRVALSAHDNRWQDVWCMVVAICEHSPARLGLAVSAISEIGEELSSELQRQLAVLGGDAVLGMDSFPQRLPLDTLSTRQWEIVTRLVRGESAREIAGALYLSPSTVRNHLAAIYRKLRVHSQTELVRSLLNQPN